MTSGSFISANGTPTTITALQSSSVKSIPSLSFPLNTQNNMAPLAVTALFLNLVITALWFYLSSKHIDFYLFN